MVESPIGVVSGNVSLLVVISVPLVPFERGEVVADDLLDFGITHAL